MSELQNAATPATGSNSPGDDPLATLHRMSTTAGLGSTDYVAINPLAVTAFVLGLASALVFLSWALLIVPLAALVLAVVALRQVSDSNGTQGGRKLAIGAILLSLVFAGIVGARAVQRYQAASEVQRQVTGVVSQLDDALKRKDWGMAYGLFSEEFRLRWPPDQFIARMNELSSSPRLGELRAVSPGDRVILDDTPTGQRGYGTISLDFSGMPQPSVLTAEYRKVAGEWQVNDIPDLFPLPEQVPSQ